MGTNVNREDAKNAKTTPRSDLEAIATVVVDSAIRVHRELGPGLLESAYQACLKYELEDAGHLVECEVPQPLAYHNIQIDVGYRIDMLVDGLLVIENKTVETLLPIHAAQLLTYLKLSGCLLGFLLNWNERLIKNGIKRFVINL